MNFILRSIVLAVLLLCFLSPVVQAEVRTWTTANGKFSVEAELVKMSDDGKSVVLYRNDQKKEITISIEKLSEKDREYLAGQRKGKGKEEKKPVPDAAKEDSELNPTVPKAQYELGLRYMTGKGVPKDAAKAVEWFQKADQKNFVPAQFELAKAYLEGNGVEKEDKKGIALIRKVLDKGYADAQYYWGVHFHGSTSESIRAEAYYWLCKAEAQEHDGAVRFLIENKPTKKDLAEMCHMAKSYLHPLGDNLKSRTPKKQEIAEALAYYRAAASFDSAEALWHLGNIHMHGKYGVKKDYRQAMNIFKKAVACGLDDAEAGDADSQYLLGNIYLSISDASVEMLTLNHGSLEKKILRMGEENTDARKWLGRATEQEHPDAMFTLGVLNYGNLGTQKEGLQMVRQAAELGSEKAKKWLSQMR